MRLRLASRLALSLACSLAACKKPPAENLVGIVTDVGGRGDQSFNDSALRGLELWGAGLKYTPSGYVPADPADVAASIPDDLHAIAKLDVAPLVLQARAQEDYEPNLQLLVDRGVKLAVGVGFMLENAVHAEALKNPKARFLLIDSPLVDERGKATTMPNVATVTFKEQEGSFLAGALAGLVTKTNKVGFVGGMELPLIKKFEAGFRAGVLTTNPAAKDVLIAYTGSFDDSKKGKEAGQDLYARGCDVVFHAAGADGLGVIQAAKEAQKLVIGVDSDQSALAPQAVLTSMVKRVDYAVWLAIKSTMAGDFKAGDTVLGLKESGVALAPVRMEFPGKQAALDRVAALRADIVSGKFVVPATIEELMKFTTVPPMIAPPQKLPPGFQPTPDRQVHGG